VLKQMCGKSEVLWIMYQYYVNGVSVSEIADMFGVRKTVVKNYIQRVKEKIGSLYRASVLLKYFVPEILKIEPVVIKKSVDIYQCRYCMVEIHRSLVEDHMRYSHVDKIEEAVERVVNSVRIRINSKSNI